MERSFLLLIGDCFGLLRPRVETLVTFDARSLAFAVGLVISAIELEISSFLFVPLKFSD